MKLNPSIGSRFRAQAGRFLPALLFVTLFASVLRAQSAGTGTVRGRVFNPATQEYVRNAEISVEGSNLVTYSDADGSYVLTGVPAGEASVTVNYTGYERATTRVTVS